jgi:wobble nucleotide-excising tRNase
MSIFDPSAQLSSEMPEVILSSSQLNALAVSVFLSLNLGVSTLPLQAAILDDPLQSLDDINLLGVVDLLRRTRDSRQLFVSTHDSRFGDLLAKKLRPVSDAQRTRVIEFEGWTRQGPTIVDQREIGQDLKPLKIAV